jgi:hypothetical protein
LAARNRASIIFFRDITFLAAGPASERTCSPADYSRSVAVKPRVAFDLDYTLGEVIVHPLSNAVVGLSLRPGCRELLAQLRPHYTMCLWTISSRWYLDAALALGLRPFFDETYAGDEIVCDWKDLRRIDVQYLIDDSVWHRDHAGKAGLAVAGYIVVPAYNSEEDRSDPLRWVHIVNEALSKGSAEPLNGLDNQ